MYSLNINEYNCLKEQHQHTRIRYFQGVTAFKIPPNLTTAYLVNVTNHLG